MNSKYKDKLVGIYAPGNYDHTSVLGQTQEFFEMVLGKPQGYGFNQRQVGDQRKETESHSNTGAVTRRRTISKDGRAI